MNKLDQKPYLYVAFATISGGLLPLILLTATDMCTSDPILLVGAPLVGALVLGGIALSTICAINGPR